MEKVVSVASYVPQIRQIKLFSYLENLELDQILKLTELVKYAQDEKVVTQGEMSPYLFAVLEGEVKVTLSEYDNHEVDICTIKEREVFGEAAVFLPEERTANVVCKEEALLLRIHSKDLFSFIRAYPQAGSRILMFVVLSLIQKLRETNQELVLERTSEVNFDYVDSMVEDFMKEI